MEKVGIVIFIILLFAAPIFGVFVGLISSNQRFSRLRRLQFLSPVIVFVVSLGIFLTFLLKDFHGNIEISFFTLNIFTSPVSLILNPLSAFICLLISIGYVFVHFGLSCYRKDLSTIKTDCSPSELLKRRDIYNVYLNLAFIALLLMNFTSSMILIIAGFFIVSITYALLPENSIENKVKTFRNNIFIDFVLICIFILSANHNQSDASESVISVIFFLIVFFKLGLPPSNLIRQITNHELKVTFLAFVHPTLMLLVLVKFNKAIFVNDVTCYIILSLVFLMLLHSLYTLFRSRNSLIIIENISNFAVLNLLLVSFIGRIEAMILFYVSVLFANTLLALTLLTLSARSDGDLTNLDDLNRFSIENFGGLRKKFSILHSFMLLSVFTLAGMLPLVGGWCIFNIFLRFSDSKILSLETTHLITSALLIFSSLLLLFAFGKVIKNIFYGEFRGTQKHFDSLQLPRKSLLIPSILLSFFILAGGVINLPGNTPLSGFLTIFRLGESSNGLKILQKIDGKITNSDFNVMLLFFLVPIIVYILSLLVHRKFQEQKQTSFWQKLDLIFMLQNNSSKFQSKLTGCIKIIADFTYTIIERVLFHSIYMLIGKFFVYFVKVLRNDFQTHEETVSSSKRYIFLGIFLIVLIVFTVLIALMV